MKSIETISTEKKNQPIESSLVTRSSRFCMFSGCIWVMATSWQAWYTGVTSFLNKESWSSHTEILIKIMMGKLVLCICASCKVFDQLSFKVFCFILLCWCPTVKIFPNFVTFLMPKIDGKRKMSYNFSVDGNIEIIKC